MCLHVMYVLYCVMIYGLCLCYVRVLLVTYSVVLNGVFFVCGSFVECVSVVCALLRGCVVGLVLCVICVFCMSLMCEALLDAVCFWLIGCFLVCALFLMHLCVFDCGVLCDVVWFVFVLFFLCVVDVVCALVVLYGVMMYGLLLCVYFLVVCVFYMCVASELWCVVVWCLVWYSCLCVCDCLHERVCVVCG